MNTEHTDIIPINKETRRRKRLFPLLFITVLLLAILIAVFIYGVIIGGKYAVKINNIDPDSIPITEYIVNGLRDLGKISFSTTLEEKEINDVLLLFESEFTPLKNIYVSPSDGSVILSGQIEKTILKEYLSTGSKKEIPEIIWIFVPEILNLKADVSLSVDEGLPTLTVNGLTVLNSDNSKELLSLGGFSNLLQGMVEDIFKDIIPKNVKIKTLTVTREGILVSGEIGLLEITE